MNRTNYTVYSVSSTSCLCLSVRVCDKAERGRVGRKTERGGGEGSDAVMRRQAGAPAPTDEPLGHVHLDTMQLP